MPFGISPTELISQGKNMTCAFPEKNLPKIYALIDKYKGEKTVVIFKSRAEADEFIERYSALEKR